MGRVGYDCDGELKHLILEGNFTWAWVGEPDRFRLSPDRKRSFDVWIHPEAYGRPVCGSVHAGGCINWQLKVGRNSGSPFPILLSNVCSNSELESTIPVSLNEWSHLAFTYDHGFVTMYVNGEMAAAGPMIISPPSNGYDDYDGEVFRLGRVSNTYYQGRIGPLTMSSKLWTPEEVNLGIRGPRWHNDPGTLCMVRWERDSTTGNAYAGGADGLKIDVGLGVLATYSRWHSPYTAAPHGYGDNALGSALGAHPDNRTPVQNARLESMHCFEGITTSYLSVFCNNPGDPTIDCRENYLDGSKPLTDFEMECKAICGDDLECLQFCASRTVSWLQDGFDVFGVAADVADISASAGGTQTYWADAGPDDAGKMYWLIGGFSGTTPGAILDGVSVPLNYDAYTGLTVSLANQGMFVNTNGLLDENGTAMMQLAVPPGLIPPGLGALGFSVDHVLLVLDAVSQIVDASSPVSLTFGI